MASEPRCTQGFACPSHEVQTRLDGLTESIYELAQDVQNLHRRKLNLPAPWWQGLFSPSTLITVGVPFLTLAVAWGTLGAQVNHHTLEIDRLRSQTRADRELLVRIDENVNHIKRQLEKEPPR